MRVKVNSLFEFDDIIHDNDWKWIYFKGERTDYRIHKDGTISTVNYNKTNETRKLLTKPNKHGYICILLHWKGEMHYIGIHRLVALAFIPKIKGKPYVNHIDGDKTNNSVNNLEWVTAKENTQHAIKTGLIKVGDDSVCSKYNESVIRSICKEFVKNELSPIEISKKYNVSYELVNRLKCHRSWHHITKEYDYRHYNKKTRAPKYGEFNGRTKLTNNDVENICVLISEGILSLKEIAEMYNTTYKTIQHIYNKTSWKRISDKYDFSNYIKSNERK